LEYKRKIYYKNVMVQIFRDHWAPFKERHPELVTDVIEENVQKMMGCGLSENGYFLYIYVLDVVKISVSHLLAKVGFVSGVQKST